MKRAWNNSLVSKVFLSYLAIIVLLFASFYLYSSTLVRNFYISSLSRQLGQSAYLLAQVIPFQVEDSNLDSYCQERSKDIGARITVIAADGRVLGDSDEPSSQMENHRNRPEVV